MVAGIKLLINTPFTLQLLVTCLNRFHKEKIVNMFCKPDMKIVKKIRIPLLITTKTPISPIAVNKIIP